MATSNSIITFRRHDLDNLRTFLTQLVIVHHTAIPFGGAGAWRFKSGAFDKSSLLLSSFNAVDQTFFMGLFFWISGRVSGQSLARNKPLSFIKSKFIRLGVPAVVYTLIIDPMVRIMVLPSWDSSTIWDSLVRCWSNISGVQGPLWYTATLLVFDMATVAASSTPFHTALSRQMETHPVGLTKVYHALSKWGWILVFLCSFLVRVYFPYPTAVPVINLQVGYATQYVYAYLLGHLSYWADEPRMIGPLDIITSTSLMPDDRSHDGGSTKLENRISIRNAIIISAVSLNLVFLPSYPPSATWFDDTMQQLAGGWNWTSLIYTTWNEVSFVLIGPALMAHFNRHHNEPTRSEIFSARNSYAAFLLHTPICTAIGLIAETFLLAAYRSSNAWVSSSIWQTIGPVIMTIGVGIPSVWTSFFIGGKLLDWIPSLRRII